MRYPAVTAIFLSLGLLLCASYAPASADRSDWQARYEKGLAAANAGDWDKAITDILAVYDESGPNPGSAPE